MNANPSIADAIIRAVPGSLMASAVYAGSGSHATALAVTTDDGRRHYILKLMRLGFLDSIPFAHLSPRVVDPLYTAIVDDRGPIVTAARLRRAVAEDRGVAAAIVPVVSTDMDHLSDEAYQALTATVIGELRSIGLRHLDWSFEFGFHPSNPGFARLFDWTSITIFDALFTRWRGLSARPMAFRIPMLAGGHIVDRYYLSTAVDIDDLLHAGILLEQPRWDSLGQGIWVTPAGLDIGRARSQGVTVASYADLTPSRDAIAQQLTAALARRVEICPAYAVAYRERLQHLGEQVVSPPSVRGDATLRHGKNASSFGIES